MGATSSLPTRFFFEENDADIGLSHHDTTVAKIESSVGQFRVREANSDDNRSAVEESDNHNENDDDIPLVYSRSRAKPTPKQSFCKSHWVEIIFAIVFAVAFGIPAAFMVEPLMDAMRTLPTGYSV